MILYDPIYELYLCLFFSINDGMLQKNLLSKNLQWIANHTEVTAVTNKLLK